MRVFALSDIHVDYETNAQWVADLSDSDYQDDVLILAGDVTDIERLFKWCLSTLAKKFRKVLFVPGNHDLWVVREEGERNSLEKFDELDSVVEACGVSMRAFHEGELSIIPLLSWYDYSFGEPSDKLKSRWMDYYYCRWPSEFREKQISEYFAALNKDVAPRPGNKVITFSHFLPRIDVMPKGVPASTRLLYPIFGTTQLEEQLRLIKPDIHIYGHSHLNLRKKIDGITYINNAFGYPSEWGISSKELLCIHEDR
jgi:predicted phosphodiesterase